VKNVARAGEVRRDVVYRQVVRDSQKKWRDEHPSYTRNYRESHTEVVERNRKSQVLRDQRDRIQNLAKNNLAFDLKRSWPRFGWSGPRRRLLQRTTWLLANSSFFKQIRRPARLGPVLEKNNVLVIDGPTPYNGKCDAPTGKDQ
jgi:hypothetical protein